MVERLDSKPVARAEERPGAPVVNHECPFAIEAPQAVLAPLEVGLQQDFSVAGGTKGMPQGAELFPKLDVVENLAVEHQHGGIVSAPHRLVAGGAEIEDRQALEAKADLAFDEHTGVIGTTVRQRADHRGHQIRRAPCAGEHANSHDAAHGYRIASISIAEPSHHNGALGSTSRVAATTCASLGWFSANVGDNNSISKYSTLRTSNPTCFSARSASCRVNCTAGIGSSAGLRCWCTRTNRRYRLDLLSSDTRSSPPGRSTRRHSASARSGASTYSRDPRTVTASNVPSAKGRPSAEAAALKRPESSLARRPHSRAMPTETSVPTY